jgi:Big-like domain-containing protein
MLINLKINQMKKKSISLVIVVFGIVCLSFHSCSKDDDKTDVSGISLNETYLSLEKGSELTIQYTISPSNATDKDISWSTNNSDIATVDNNGKVTGINPGPTTITATASSGVSAGCDIAVYDGSETQRLAWKGITKDLTLTFTNPPSPIVAVLYNDNNEFIKTITWINSSNSVPENGSIKSIHPIIENLGLIENEQLTYLDCSNNSITNLLFFNSLTALTCDNCPDLSIVNIEGANEIVDININVLNTLKVIPNIIVIINEKAYIYEDGEWVEKQS